jgi:hypothetical protein
MTPFHQVDLIESGRIVRVRRSERRFESALELSQERVLMVEKLNGIGRTGRGLLIDSRFAPSSTDDHMQDEFRRFRLEVSRGFERVATLVRTKVAILQVNRLCAAQTVSVQPFNEEADAIAYLLSTPPSGRHGSLRP